MKSTTTEVKRHRNVCSFTLSNEARENLKAAAQQTGLSMSRLVEILILNMEPSNVEIRVR